jgi:SAM-dependent methyltransferase
MSGFVTTGRRSPYGADVRHERVRYDGLAEYYEGSLTGRAGTHTRRVRALLAALLGEGNGRCLDVGCGTGFHADLLAGLGWTPIGVDLSAQQLGYARVRLPVALADAARLPITRGSLFAVIATHIHTDVDDWEAVCREAARVLASGGRFVYVGAHPCFCGAFADRRPDGRVLLHEGYLDADLRFDGPGLSPDGVRARAGSRQRTLEDLLTAVLAAGLRLTAIREDADAPTPDLIGFQAEQP